MVEKHEAQFGTITAQLSNITEILSRLSLPSSNNSNQPSSSSNLASQPLPNPKNGLNAITLCSGACVSIMPLSIFARLKLSLLKRSAAKFALADKSVITVMEIAEDVLVAIKDLVFPVDFYIIEMPPTENRSSSSVLLVRPFLKTSKFKLDAFIGTYSFEVRDKTIKFNLDEAMKYLPEEHSVF
ncbi:uncharacterized protein LOC107607336 [Arachis ipaensis]|uniref:uncharacterized protein LOC107607336 n=1 Tax=Arachis ipaensis TaxID=130454 RepID=UPI0007AF8CD7|nr:uncharacterized protein LOC107607336 [Arachis ipaensis]